MTLNVLPWVPDSVFCSTDLCVHFSVKECNFDHCSSLIQFECRELIPPVLFFFLNLAIRGDSIYFLKIFFQFYEKYHGYFDRD